MLKTAAAFIVLGLACWVGAAGCSNLDRQMMKHRLNLAGAIGSWSKDDVAARYGRPANVSSDKWVIDRREDGRAGYDHLEFTFDNTGILNGWYADIRSRPMTTAELDRSVGSKVASSTSAEPGSPISPPVAVASKPVVTDSTPPVLTIESPGVGVVIPNEVSRLPIRGRASDPSGVAEVIVDGRAAALGAVGDFSSEMLLAVGTNKVVVAAIDRKGNRSETAVEVKRADATAASANSPSEERIALVIGNATYSNAPLANPVNDASDMNAVLRSLGFKVTLLLNAPERLIRDTVKKFAEERKPGSIALFYFAGHGVQLDGENYMIPTDAEIDRLEDVRYAGVQLGWVLELLETGRRGQNFVILDACRDNPYKGEARSTTRGLAPIQTSAGTFVAFSTAPGSVARDGSGRNGLYTKHLLTCITLPGLSVEEMFKQVRRGVTAESKNLQTPWESSSLTESFSFSR